MKKNIILTICILLVLCVIIINPQHYISVTLNALNVWANVLLPSLLPFFIFTKMLSSLGTVGNLTSVFSPITVNIYKNSKLSAYTFFMSILTGYPVGSKLIADLYKERKLTKSQAVRSLTFCSNSGPMFILGSVGISMLGSKSSGYIMLISHIVGALLNGIVYRNFTPTDTSNHNITTNNQKNTENLLSSSVLDSITSIMLVGGIIVIAFVVIEVLQSVNLFYPIAKLLSLFKIDPSTSLAIINGFFEITKGTLSIAQLNLVQDLKTIICSTLIAFGGICTMLQSMAFVKNFCSFKFMFLQKTTHAIFTCVVSIVLVIIF